MTLTWRSPGRQAPFHRSMQGKNELEQSTSARRTKTRRMSGSPPSYTLLADPHLIMDVRYWHLADDLCRCSQCQLMTQSGRFSVLVMELAESSRWGKARFQCPIPSD